MQFFLLFWQVPGISGFFLCAFHAFQAFDISGLSLWKTTRFRKNLLNWVSKTCPRAKKQAHVYLFFSDNASKYDKIILICGHMAQKPYFPGGPNMCLMGDIQVSHN